jgi:hypothetical protein
VSNAALRLPSGAALVYFVARVEPNGEIVATLVRGSSASPEALLEGFCRFLRFETEQMEH